MPFLPRSISRRRNGWWDRSSPRLQWRSSSRHPIWGTFSDRYGRRPAMLTVWGFAFAYVIFGFAASLWMLFASRIVQGLGGGTNPAWRRHMLPDTMEPAERAKALGCYRPPRAPGVVIGPFIGSAGLQLRPPGARAGRGRPGADQRLLRLAMAAGVARRRTRAAERTLRRPRGSGGCGRRCWRSCDSPPRRPHRVIWIYVVGCWRSTIVIGVPGLYLKDTFGIGARTIGYFLPDLRVVGVIMPRRSWVVQRALR